MRKTIFFAMMAVCSMNMRAQFSGLGTGTEKDPYQITNADQLFDVRNDLTAYYKVMNDIDLGAWIQEDNPVQGWMPIGNTTTPFEGVFDGNFKLIKGLFVNRSSTDYVGLFGTIKGATVKNTCILNPQISGKDYVGIIGSADGKASFILSNIIVIGGKIEGNNFVGGILGGKSVIDYNATREFYIVGNYSSSTIYAKQDCGGICGLTTSWGYRPSGNFQQLFFYDNHFAGNIHAEKNIGGILGRSDTTTGYDDFQRNLVGGSLNGESDVNGVYGINTTWSSNSYNIFVKDNVCYADTISSKQTIPSRIVPESPKGFSNNYSSPTVVIMTKGRQAAVEDDDYNGTTLGTKTVKRKDTYVGMDFDFDKQWTIVDGLTVPFNIHQSVPSKVTKFESGSRGKIIGTTTGKTGTVYVLIGDVLYESFIVDGQWEVILPTTIDGTVARVAVATDNLLPSIFVKAIAETTTVEPTKTVGDANGDGVVDSADVTAIINYILGKPSASFNKENADVTGDGEILIDDAVQTVQLIMNAQ